jgi:tRNA threonylcarbamoyladenosine biosynthesis protein TsaB
MVKLPFMKILALETATTAGSVALINERILAGEVMIDIHTAHAERLMPAINWLLRATHTPIKEIDAFAVSIGPGSFTGLRIGLSTAKGFSYATGKPTIPVPTLDAFARTLPYCGHFICPMLDARKNEIYTSLYVCEDNICNKVIPETAVEPRYFLKHLKTHIIKDNEKSVVFTGDGARLYREIILEIMRKKAIFAPSSKMSPSASTVAELGIEIMNQGTSFDPATITPFYIRKSEAELHWKE